MIDSLYLMLMMVAVPALLDCSAAVTMIRNKEKEKAENKERILKVLRECAEQSHTNYNEMIVALMKPEKNSNDPFKCAWACVFKSLDVLDSKGIYQPNTAIENIFFYDNNNQDEQLWATVKRCASVNDEPVSDGATGCDRAQLLVNCITSDIIRRPGARR